MDSKMLIGREKEKALIENSKKKWYNRVFDFIKSIFKKKEQ